MEQGSRDKLDELRRLPMTDRSVTFTGIRFENPFLLSSAPPTESEHNIIRACYAAWGGVGTKTIGMQPVTNVVGAKTKSMLTGSNAPYWRRKSQASPSV